MTSKRIVIAVSNSYALCMMVTAMEKLISSKRFLSDPTARNFLERIESKENHLKLSTSVFYYDFPTFRDYEDESCKANALILSPIYGILAFSFCRSDAAKNESSLLLSADEALSQFFSILFGRLLKSRLLRRSRDELAFSLIPIFNDWEFHYILRM